MDMAIYDYIGKVDLLNQYVIRGSYFEAGDYFFIDKDTGKKTSLIGKPFLSPDGKYIVCLNMEEMDGVVHHMIDIIEGMEKFCKEQNIKNLEEIRGII